MQTFQLYKNCTTIKSADKAIIYELNFVMFAIIINLTLIRIFLLLGKSDFFIIFVRNYISYRFRRQVKCIIHVIFN